MLDLAGIHFIQRSEEFFSVTQLSEQGAAHAWDQCCKFCRISCDASGNVLYCSRKTNPAI